MAHVKSVEQYDGGRCGEQIEAARCRDTMLKLYQVRARNDLKHHHELGKNESGDITSGKNGERPMGHANRGGKVSRHNVEIVPSESEK